MVKYWIILSTQWKLEDVQAALNVIISLLCFIAVFTSARYFWHSSARHISRNDEVPISSLLSFTTIGEALDVIGLLRSRLFHATHFRLAIQCLLVIVFSVAAIFAGPISRYSTRVGQTYNIRPVNGLLASKSYSCDIDNYIRWRDISSALDRADFPFDQLPDFLPNLDQDYVYRSVDWNSTYSAQCTSTGQTKIKLEATGNYTDTSYYLYDEIPALADTLSDRFQKNASSLWTSYSGTKNPDDNVWSSLAMFQYAELRPDDDWESNSPTERISISIAAIGMNDAPLYQMTASDSVDYGFGIGEIPDAWYTKIECDLTRSRPITDKNQWEANVDLSTDCDVAGQMTTYFAPSALYPQADHSTQINLPFGDDLFRFYQSWNIAKDTHFPTNTTRDLHLRLKTVELSTVFIAVVSLITLIVVIGFVHCLITHLLYKHVYKRIPETKVDWLLQSLREAEGKETNNMATLPEAEKDTSNASQYKSLFASTATAPRSSDTDADGGYQPYNPTHGNSASRTQSQRQHPRRMRWEQAHYSLIPQAPLVDGSARPEELHIDRSSTMAKSLPRTAEMGSIHLPTVSRISIFGLANPATYRAANS